MKIQSINFISKLNNINFEKRKKPNKKNTASTINSSVYPYAPNVILHSSAAKIFEKNNHILNTELLKVRKNSSKVKKLAIKEYKNALAQANLINSKENTYTFNAPAALTKNSAQVKILNSAIDQITVYNPDTNSTNIYFYKHNKPEMVIIGETTNSDGTRKIDKFLLYDSNFKLITYQEGIIETNECHSMSKTFNFKQDRLSEYKEDVLIDSSGSFASQELYYENGYLKKAFVDRIVAKNYTNSKECFNFN